MGLKIPGQPLRFFRFSDIGRLADRFDGLAGESLADACFGKMDGVIGKGGQFEMQAGGIPQAVRS